MSDPQSPLVPGTVPGSPSFGLSAPALARAIYKAEVPEQFVRRLPPQSLHMVVRNNGLSSSVDLIEMASITQCRLLLDLDCWKHDRIDEERLWEWLQLHEEEDELKILQKFLKFVDLKIVALLIARYVHFVTFEEPTDNPPGPGYYTPDKGYTWVGVASENPDRHFMLSRLLALVFATSAELFYQLLSTSQVATDAVLEEEAFQEKCKRLGEEGIPDQALAAEINGGFSEAEALAELAKSQNRHVVQDIRPITPLLYEGGMDEPLAGIFLHARNREELEAELTLIMNAALVRWNADTGDYESVKHIVEKVKGALNVGIETLSKKSGASPSDVAEKLGLQKAYRVGLANLFELQRNAKKALLERRPEQATEPLTLILEAASRPFPEIPAFFIEEKEAQGPQLDVAPRAINGLKSLEALRQKLALA